MRDRLFGLVMFWTIATTTAVAIVLTVARWILLAVSFEPKDARGARPAADEALSRGLNSLTSPRSR